MKITTIGLDLAKRVFQAHGVNEAGATVLRRQLKRRQVEPFFAKLPACLVGIEACGTAHYWARRLSALGHDVRLVPPAYAKAYVRRNKTDPADAEAICEAVSRPSMRFVPIKTETDQAIAAVHRVRDRLIGQRTMLLNALRGHMAEFGFVVRKGPGHVKELVERLTARQRARNRAAGAARPGWRAERARAADRDGRQAAGELAPEQPAEPSAGDDSWAGTDYQHRDGGPRAAAAKVSPPATSRPGSDWCPGKTPRAARSGWGRSASKATVICAASWSTAPRRCLPASAPRPTRGSNGCSPPSRAWSQR